MNHAKTRKIARFAQIILVFYAVSLTAVTALAFTVGPYKDSIGLWVKLRSIEAKFRTMQKGKADLEKEKDRLLATIKALRADWVAQQDSLRVLREAVKEPDVAKKLVESTNLLQQFNNERTILLLKINELQQQLKRVTEKQAAGAQEEKGSK